MDIIATIETGELAIGNAAHETAESIESGLSFTIKLNWIKFAA
ncbi:hypothetical protein [Sphingobium bisphenolivorans]|nr:hypothetical protein [Sphingobium bisphenolivorans]